MVTFIHLNIESGVLMVEAEERTLKDLPKQDESNVQQEKVDTMEENMGIEGGECETIQSELDHEKKLL